MKRLGILVLSSSVAFGPWAASPVQARHHHHHDGGNVIGDVIEALVVTGLVVAAIGLDSQNYYGSPWGVIDTEITPKDAAVYVNGAYAGKARKFDGWPGYLPLEPGRYTLEFRYQGYKSFRVKVRSIAGRRLVIKKHLYKLAPGEAPAPAPQYRGGGPDSGDDDQDWRWERDNDPDLSSGGYRIPDEDRPSNEDRRSTQGPPPAVDRPESTGSTPKDAGDMRELKLEVTPEDASIYLNGEFYANSKDLEGGARGLLLSPGEYKVEVVRPGYKAQSFTVVLGDQPRTLKVVLEKEQQ